MYEPERKKRERPCSGTLGRGTLLIIKEGFFVWETNAPGLLRRQLPQRRGLETSALYDRIMNLSKHFWKALDSTGNLAIMVLALRNKEC